MSTKKLQIIGDLGASKAFSSVNTISGSVTATVSADSKSDGFTLEAGDNITLITNESTGVIKIVGADAPEAPEASLEALGVSVTPTELNRVAGVTSNIQGQLDNLGDLIGDESVADQISTAIADKADADHTHTAAEVGADASGSAASALSSAKTYTDTKISDLINSAPTTLDTLGEIATAMEENADVVEALNDAIGTKADASDLSSHTSNKSNPHGVTLGQLGVTAAAEELNYVDGVTSNVQTQLNNLSGLVGDKAVSEQIDDAMDKAITGLSVSGKTVTYTKGDGSTGTITTQDTNTTYSAGTGISLSGTTFSNSGVRSVATGSTNGTISVNTNGTTANVAVKGLGSAAYTASTAYDASGAANTALTNAKAYTDAEIAEWVGDSTVASQISTAVDAITYSDVGAAPAGYGLGGLAKILSSADDLNTLKGTGFFRWGSDMPANAPFSYSVMLQIQRGDGDVFQKVWQLGLHSGVQTSAERVVLDDVGEWEHSNPPMYLGVEYRTTERIEGKAVYKKKDSSGKVMYRLDGSDTWNDYTEIVGAAPATEVQASYTLATSAELDSTLSSVLSSLANGTAKTIHIIYQNSTPIGQGDWFMTVRRATADYGTVEAIHDHATGILKRYRTYYNGAWADWVDIPNHTHTLASIGAAPASHTHSSLMGWADTRTVGTTPNDYNSMFRVMGIKNSDATGTLDGSDFSTLVGIRGWADASGGHSHEIAFTGNGELYRRHGVDTSWYNWVRMLDSNNYSSYCLPITGGNLTGSLWLSPSGSERDIGIEYATDKALFLYGNSSTGIRGLYDTTNGTVISVANGTNTFYGNATTATAATTADTATTVRGTYTANGGAQPPSYIGHSTVRFNMMNQYKGLSNLPTYADCILMDTYNGSDVPYVTSLGIIKDSNPRAFIAVGAKGDTTTWLKQTEIVTDNNIGSKTSGYAGTLNGVYSTSVPLVSLGEGQVKYYAHIAGDATGVMPTSNNANGILMFNTHNGEYHHQLGFSPNGMYHRCTNGSALTDSLAWNAVLTSANYSAYAATAGHTHSNYVPTSRTVNGKALSSNISLTYSDVGAAASSHTHSYLPLSGGDLTGEVTAPRFTGILGSTDTRDQDFHPNEYGYAGMKLEFKNASAIGISDGTYVQLSTYQPWADTTQWSGGKATQIAFGDSGKMYLRKGNGSGWDSWRAFSFEGHTHDYVPTSRTVNGKALSGNITLSASDVSALPISGGTLTGTTVAASTAVGTSGIRNIHAGTGALTSGSSSLATGAIYIQYE